MFGWFTRLLAQPMAGRSQRGRSCLSCVNWSIGMVVGCEPRAQGRAGARRFSWRCRWGKEGGGGDRRAAALARSEFCAGVGRGEGL